jgi:hypothetical protein
LQVFLKLSGVVAAMGAMQRPNALNIQGTACVAIHKRAEWKTRPTAMTTTIDRNMFRKDLHIAKAAL